MFLNIALVLHSQVVFFGISGKSAGTNIGSTAGDSILNDRPRIRMASNKFGCPIQQPEHVFDDKNLPVTDAAGCDAGGGCRYCGSDLGSETGRDALDHHRHGAAASGALASARTRPLQRGDFQTGDDGTAHSCRKA